MERIQIIKNFLDLVGMTKDERVSLIQALMYEWHLTENDIIVSSAAPPNETETPVPTPESNTTSEAKTPASTPENDTTSETKEQEQIQDIQPSYVENPVSEAPAPKKRGRKKKTDEGNPSPEIPAPKKRGRPKKIKEDASPLKEETLSSEAATSQANEPETPAEKNKKPRGRKKRTSTKDDEPKLDQTWEKPFDNDYVEEEPSFDEDEAAAKAALSDLEIENLLDNEPKTRSKETRRRNPNFLYLADFPDLKKLIIGQEYPFEFLYRWKDKNLLSPYVLNGMMPIGIYVRYQKLIFGKYRGFIVSIYDEHVITNISEAYQEAEKLPAIDDEVWTVMNSLQWSVLKTYISSINRMLSKVGGDSLQNNYRTCSPKSNTVCGIGNLRYTIDVK